MSPSRTRPPHRFANPRPPSRPPAAQASPLYPGSPFQKLPPPTGSAPFRLDLDAVVPDRVRAMRRTGTMCLHMVGDTGGVKDPHPQAAVARAMEADAAIAGPCGTPSFFYHLGDVIYFDGQAQEYLPQFYEPYARYDLPILGIPGNHDGDVFDDGTRTNPLPSLATFMRNFCAPEAGTHSPDAGECSRTAMVQPNCYFTLETPLATFVGLYTNVPEGGVVEPDQEAWFAAELAAAPDDRPLIVAMHHPVYSLDTYHSGSAPMGALLARATARAGREPHAVFAAHVHDYQRFSVASADGGGTIPYVVAGMGGYHDLHALAEIDGAPPMTPYPVPGAAGVTLERAQDDRFGFLRLEIDRESITISSYAVPPPNGAAGPATLFDRARLDWRTRRLA